MLPPDGFLVSVFGFRGLASGDLMSVASLGVDFYTIIRTRVSTLFDLFKR